MILGNVRLERKTLNFCFSKSLCFFPRSTPRPYPGVIELMNRTKHPTSAPSDALKSVFHPSRAFSEFCHGLFSMLADDNISEDKVMKLAQIAIKHRARSSATKNRGCPATTTLSWEVTSAHRHTNWRNNLACVNRFLLTPWAASHNYNSVFVHVNSQYNEYAHHFFPLWLLPVQENKTAVGQQNRCSQLSDKSRFWELISQV